MKPSWAQLKTMEDKMLNDDGLVAGPSVQTESEAAEEDSILETDSKGAKMNNQANPCLQNTNRKTQETMKSSSQRQSRPKTL